MQSFLKPVETDFKNVNDLIVDHLHSEVDLVENIGHYIVNSGGKRLRPVLVLLVANALNYKGKQHLDLAAIIEFIHTATLLHDDVVDISSMRRGRPTANAKWGNAPSVLVGDFLYSRAFQVMVGIRNMDIMAVISDTTNVISEGEVQQLANAKNPAVTEKDYMTVIHKKTAALFEAACETAAIVADSTPEMRLAARQYGYHIGIAFQLIDDSLDYTGDPETLGKNVGDDLAEGKPTLPLIHALANTTASNQDVIAQAIKMGDAEKLQEIIAIVNEAGSIDYVKQQAIEHAEKAIQVIERFPESPFKQAMQELANFSVERSY